MSANVPVLPIAGATALRGSFSLLALVSRWLKDLARARRHRREAQVLAGLDQRMLADMGVYRADLDEAFSSPFWEDPTELVCARVKERRKSRPLPRRRPPAAPTEAPPLQPHQQPTHRRALPMI
jgi:uncharacterized protein YjiS (DUF1127 family)